jgi:hypothetical protein
VVRAAFVRGRESRRERARRAPQPRPAGDPAGRRQAEAEQRQLLDLADEALDVFLDRRARLVLPLRVELEQLVPFALISPGARSR